MHRTYDNAYRANHGFGLPKLADLMALHRQRRTLRHLSEAQLADIGLTADEAEREAARPIWDVPSHWLR